MMNFFLPRSRYTVHVSQAYMIAEYDSPAPFQLGFQSDTISVRDNRVRLPKVGFLAIPVHKSKWHSGKACCQCRRICL